MKNIDIFFNVHNRRQFYFNFSQIGTLVIICLSTFLAGCSTDTAPDNKTSMSNATSTPYIQSTNTETLNSIPTPYSQPTNTRSNVDSTPYTQPTNTKSPINEAEEVVLLKFIVENESDSTRYEGLKNEKGEIIIEPKYAKINYLGKGLYSVVEKLNFRFLMYCPMAIFNSKGEQLTDFCFYNVGQFQGDYASVCDETTTFFIDTSGKRVDSLPRLDGIGEMKILGDKIRADIDKETIFLTRDGEIISAEDDTITVNDNIKVKKKKYRPDSATLVVYPEFINLPNKDMEAKINSTIKELFIKGNEASYKEDGLYRATMDFTEFTIEVNKNLLSIIQKGVYYGVGGAHAHPKRKFINIDLNTGKVYALSDLFKNKNNYLDSLANLISDKKYDSLLLDIVKMYITDEFIIDDEYLKIVFKPYSGSIVGNNYAIFSIPYSLIIDQIDTNGKLWNSFDKIIDNNLNELLVEYEGLKG